MTVLDTVALAAAERVESTLGARAALSAYRTLAQGLPAGEGRVRATLGALRCAARVEDARIETLIDAWRVVGTAPVTDRVAPGSASRALREIASLCGGLLDAGRSRAAVELARAETERAPGARAHYLFARCLERADERGAAAQAYARAIRLARDDAAVAAGARARRIALLLEDASTSSAAVDEAMAAALSDASVRERVVLLAARLASPSRYTRAAALDALEEIAARASADVAASAARVAAHHVDASASALTAIEVDRARAVVAHWRVRADRDRALERLDALAPIAERSAEGGDVSQPIARAADTDSDAQAHLDRARSVLAHGVAGPRPGSTSPRRLAAALALEAIAALRKGRIAEAEDALEAVRTRAEIDPSAPLWTALSLALATRDGRLRGSAAELAASLLGARSRSVAPPRGFLALARTLAEAGLGDLETRAVEAAAAAHEPGARERLAARRVAQGWELAARGERDAAIAALRAARRMRSG